ncbi:prepilin-type N-terminal cleavage/methylation domain-containing protein [Desulfogranum marinum]|uniref:prepilin-type N-terminal cleavage/methylation domain-containing protein n=1 Tax=Desulfogranum marinum TaxID=453220 RepID=UPI001964C22E|nr:prepilin-type N-terminal cleavage/methylation domain-containing protein [Desulfogranum marinum]MBM9513567.1 prepilin-type N-terminal cleavage/methylation domain-containing protein [Desulfogranum marinum]
MIICSHSFFRQNSRGFTLIELMIAMVISTMILAAVYGAYKVQQDHGLAQEQVTEMQQNLRVGLNALVREARYAGYDPDDKGYGITGLGANEFRFTMDNDDGGMDSRDLALYAPGDADADDTNSVRITSGGSAVADNIEELEFRYLNEDNDVTTIPQDIRTVTITMLARADNPDRKFTSVMTYTSPSATTWGPHNDNFRRRMQSVTVKLRNMGLNDE